MSDHHGGVPVVSDPVRLEAFGHGEVLAPPLAGGNLGVEHLTQLRVIEPVGVTVLIQHPAFGGELHDAVERGVVEAGHGLEVIEALPVAEQSGPREQVGTFGADPLQADSELVVEVQRDEWQRGVAPREQSVPNPDGAVAHQPVEQ